MSYECHTVIRLAMHFCKRNKYHIFVHTDTHFSCFAFIIPFVVYLCGEVFHALPGFSSMSNNLSWRYSVCGDIVYVHCLKIVFFNQFNKNMNEKIPTSTPLSTLVGIISFEYLFTSLRILCSLFRFI